VNYDELVARYGDFTAHNLNLEGVPGGYTLGDRKSADDEKIRRVTQIASDLFGGDLTGKRVLDIACLEGVYGIELALRGAKVTAVEIREANLQKARFAAKALGADANMTFVEADILSVDLKDFDLILCLGIFYHFDRTDTFRFAEKVMEMLKPGGHLILDTAISAYPHAVYRHRGVRYFGNPWVEHMPWTSAARKKAKLWQSVTYNTAIYLTRASIARLFGNLGCTSFHECSVPGEPGKNYQRATFVGTKGTAIAALTNPWIDRAGSEVRERNVLARILAFFTR
jgi:2-polyprenyl-3-methyl-5-hydroxy-6-metoxy-1,4-benzoquinol methylase